MPPSSASTAISTTTRARRSSSPATASTSTQQALPRFASPGRDARCGDVRPRVRGASPSAGITSTARRAALRCSQAAGTTYTFCGHVHDQQLYFGVSGGRMSAFTPLPGVPVPVRGTRAVGRHRRLRRPAARSQSGGRVRHLRRREARADLLPRHVRPHGGRREDPRRALVRSRSPIASRPASDMSAAIPAGSGRRRIHRRRTAPRRRQRVRLSRRRRLPIARPPSRS